MRPNREYWNRNLPQSAIQFMILEIPEREEVKRKMEDQLRRQDVYYFISRMLYEVEPENLLLMIKK
jgi:hypothetical protein